MKTHYTLMDGSSMCMMKKMTSLRNHHHLCLLHGLFILWNPNSSTIFHNRLMMDCTDQNSSAIQGEGYYFDRLLLESNCFSRSYRSYYPTSFPETVPFQWEKRPGLPKKSPGITDDVTIPLSPPPALHGLGLALPRSDYDHRSSRRWTARFWRRISNAAGRSCSSSSADRRLPSCSVPSSIDKRDTGAISSLSDLRQFYVDSDGVVATPAAGSSSGLRYSSFSSNSSSLSTNFQCGHNKCSSAGESSRMYYCGGNGVAGVPFDWEMQPGKSKDAGDEDEIEIIPPPTPPPAVQSRGLPIPRFDDPAVSEPSKAGSITSCFKYRTGSERRLEEQPPFCCRLRPWKIDDDDEKEGLPSLLSLLLLFRNRK